MKGSSLRLAELSGQIQTIGAARETLRVATEHLELARKFVANTTSHHFSKAPLSTFTAWLSGAEGDVQAEIVARITTVESLVSVLAGVYRGATDDLFDQEISTLNSMRIANALQRSNDVLNSAIEEYEDIPDLDFVGAIAEVLAAVGKAIANTVQAAANVAAGVVSAFWLPLLVVGAGAGVVLAWRAGAFKGGGGA